VRERAAAGDPALTWYDYGLQGVDLEDLDEVDLDDPENWAATNPAYGVPHQ
jgi:phage terminase large subunit-like protein